MPSTNATPATRALRPSPAATDGASAGLSIVAHHHGKGGGSMDESAVENPNTSLLSPDTVNGATISSITSSAAFFGQRNPAVIKPHDDDEPMIVIDAADVDTAANGRGGEVGQLNTTVGRAVGGRRVETFTSLSLDSIVTTSWSRISMLVSLLLLQSLSQFILERYETLLSQHVIVPLFLTMLVGAGGNAGNQSAVRSITGLVSGEFKGRDFWRVLRKEVLVGLINSCILAAIGFSRVYYFYGHRNLFWSTVAVTASLFCIVFTSVVLGTCLPFALGRLGYDREHAAPIIQVLMDISGVLITCTLCTAIIPESEHTSTKAPLGGGSAAAGGMTTLAPGN